MFKFFEPEDDFRPEELKCKNKNVKIKILLTVVIVFGLTSITMVRSNFINIFKSDSIEWVCVNGNSYNRVDDDELKLIKAKKVLRDHLASLSELDGLLEAKIKLDNSSGNQPIPFIKFIFREDSLDKDRIPEGFCGFRTLIELE